MNDNEVVLESQIREMYGRVVYTHKTHEKCADILKTRSNRLKLIEIILSAATTTTILVVIFGDNEIFKFVAALCSTALLALTLYSKDFDLLIIAEDHKNAALNILEVRESLLTLLVDLKIGNRDIAYIQQARDDANAALISTFRGAPKTTSKAYRLASTALKENEEFTFTDVEIDKFLPESLRRGTGDQHSTGE